MVDLDALEAAAKAATHGKWFIAGLGRVACQAHGVIIECALYYRAGEADQKANAAYIVAAQPRVMRELIAEVERLRGALEKIAEERDAGRHDGLPEPCPAHEAEVMWHIARAALAGDRHD